MIAAWLGQSGTNPARMLIGDKDIALGWGWRVTEAITEWHKGTRFSHAIFHLPWGTASPGGASMEFDAYLAAREIPALKRMADTEGWIASLLCLHMVTAATLWVYLGAPENSPELCRLYAQTDRRAWRGRVTSCLNPVLQLRDRIAAATGGKVGLLIDGAGDSSRTPGTQTEAICRIAAAAGLVVGVEPFGAQAWNKGLASVTLTSQPGGIPDPRTLAQPAFFVPNGLPYGDAMGAWVREHEGKGWVPAVGLWPGSLGTTTPAAEVAGG